MADLTVVSPASITTSASARSNCASSGPRSGPAGIIRPFRETPQSFVYGSRFAGGAPKGMPVLRRWGNALLARWGSRLLRRRVTDALWNVEEGDTIGFRGPYGNCYPMDKWRGKLPEPAAAKFSPTRLP